MLDTLIDIFLIVLIILLIIVVGLFLVVMTVGVIRYVQYGIPVRL